MDTWDLTPLFADDAAWEAAYDVDISALAGYRGRLGEGAEVVRELLELSLGLQRRVEALYTYAHLRHDENLGDDRAKGLYQKALVLYQSLQVAGAWIEPELLSLPQLPEYIEALPEVRFLLEKLARMQPHTLPAEQEGLLALATKALSAPHQAFGALTNADFDFGKVADSQGDEHELTQGSYAQLMRSPDRLLRKNAFEKIHSHFDGYANTLAELFGGQVEVHLFEARARQFGSCLDAALFPKGVDTAVYRSLISAVREGLPALHSYLDLRKRALGVDGLHLYDVYAPLVEVEMTMDWDEAVGQVIASVAPLGKDYQTKLQQGLGEERWCDRYERRGKRSGAYSSGCFDSHPYILMNYHGILNDVFTLAHEAGHSMHSHLSRKHQPYHYADYPIFVAEVASTFNEALLLNHLLKSAEGKERAYLLAHELDGLRATLFRQVMFAEFELWAHEQAEQGTPLTPSLLREKYLQLNRDYFGPDVVVDELIGAEWSRIPHFYYNFYVYQYATGISAALALVEKGDIDRYLGFLSSGYSSYPVDLLKNAGVDVTTGEPVSKAIARFTRLTKELELLLD